MENKEGTTNYENKNDVNSEGYANAADLWRQFSPMSWGKLYDEYIKYIKRMSEIYYEYAGSSQRMTELYKDLAANAEKMTELYKESAKSTEEMSKYWLKYFWVNSSRNNRVRQDQEE